MATQTGPSDPAPDPAATTAIPPADLAAQLDALREAAGKARAEQRDLNQALRDADYQEAAAELARLTGMNVRLAGAQRELADLAARRAALASGQYALESQDRARRRRDAAAVGRQEQAVDLEVRRRDLTEGRYAQEVQEQAEADRVRRGQDEAERAVRIGQRREDVVSGRFAAVERPRLANDLDDRQAADEERAARAALRRQDVASGRYADRYATRSAADAADRRADEEERAVRLRARLENVRSGRYAGQYAAEFRGDAVQRRAETEEAGVRHRFDVAGRHVAAASGRYAEEHGAERARAIDLERVRLAERLSYVRSGGYARELNEIRRLDQIRARERRESRRAELEVRYGRQLGGLVDRYGPAAGGLARAGERAGTMLAATGTGLVMRGFSNTVEWNRFELELTLATRELAGAFKPALQAVTEGLRDAREWLSALSPRQQRNLGRAGVALAGTLAVNALTRGLTGHGLGGLAMAGLSGLAALRGAVPAGGTAGSAIANYAPTAAAVYAQRRLPPAPPQTTGIGQGVASGAGAAALSRGATLRAGATRLGVYGAAAYAAYRTVLDPSERSPDDEFRQKHVRGLAEQNPEYAGLKTAEEFEQKAREARENETGGVNFIKRHLGGLGADVWDVLQGVTGYEGKRDDFRPLSDRLTEQAARMRGEEKSRLTQAGGGFGESGSSYDRISEGLTMTAIDGDRKERNRDEELRKIREGIEKVAENTAPKAEGPPIRRPQDQD